MRIALVVAGGFDRSGREHVIPSLLCLTERLARQHDVVVYVLRYLAEPATYSLVGATVRDLGRPRGIAAQYRRLVAAMKTDGPFDVVHGYWALPCGLVAAAAGRRLGVPAVVTCDSGEFVSIPEIEYGSQFRARQRLAVWAAVRLATRVTVCSRYQADLARAHGIDPDVIPLGADRTVFGPAPRSEGPPWRLLHVASINRVKDHDTLLRAFESASRRGLDAHLDVVGLDTLNGSVAALARQLGIERRMTMHGFLASDELVPLYQQSHLLLVSSRHEAAGVVILEGALCRLPAAGTAVGYLKDWSPNRALAVAPRNPEALARAVESLLNDHANRERLAVAARDWALAHDADWTAAQFLKLYDELTRPGPR